MKCHLSLLSTSCIYSLLIFISSPHDTNGQLLGPLMSLAGGLASNLNPFHGLAQTLTGASGGSGGGLLSGLRSAASSPASFASVPSALSAAPSGPMPVPAPAMPFASFGAGSSINYGSNQIPMLTPLELAEIMHSQSQSESQFQPGYNSGPRGPTGTGSNNNANYNEADDEEAFDENGRGFDSPVDDYRGAPISHHPQPHPSSNNLPPPHPRHQQQQPPVPPPSAYHNSPPLNGPRGNLPPPPAAASAPHQPLNGPRPYNSNNNEHRPMNHPQPAFDPVAPAYQRSPSNNHNNDYDRPYENEADYERPYDGGNTRSPYDGRGDYDRGVSDDQSNRGYRGRSPANYQDEGDHDLPPPPPPPAARQPQMYSTMNRMNNNRGQFPPHQMDNSNAAPVSAAGGYDEGPRNLPSHSAPIAHASHYRGNTRPEQPPNRPTHWSYNSMHNRQPPVNVEADEPEENGEGDRDDPRPVEYRRAPSEPRPQASLYGYYNSNDFNKNLRPEHEEDQSARRRRRRLTSNSHFNHE